MPRLCPPPGEQLDVTAVAAGWQVPLDDAASAVLSRGQENAELQKRLSQLQWEAEEARARLAELDLEVQQKTNRLAEVELRLKDSLAERAEEEERLSRRLRDSQETIASLKSQPQQIKVSTTGVSNSPGQASELGGCPASATHPLPRAHQHSTVIWYISPPSQYRHHPRPPECCLPSTASPASSPPSTSSRRWRWSQPRQSKPCARASHGASTCRSRWGCSGRC